MDKAAAKAKRTLLTVEIPRDELAFRIAKVCLGMRPTKPITATEALDQLAVTQPDIIASFRAAADAAVIYFHECLSDAVQPS